MGGLSVASDMRQVKLSVRCDNNQTFTLIASAGDKLSIIRQKLSEQYPPNTLLRLSLPANELPASGDDSTLADLDVPDGATLFVSRRIAVDEPEQESGVLDSLR